MSKALKNLLTINKENHMYHLYVFSSDFSMYFREVIKIIPYKN